MDKKYAIQTEHQWKLNYVDIELNPTVPQRVEVHLCSLGRVGWDLRQNHLPYFSDQIRLAQTSSSQMTNNSNLSFITLKQHTIRLAQTSPSSRQWHTTLVTTITSTFTMATQVCVFCPHVFLFQMCAKTGCSLFKNMIVFDSLANNH